MPRRTPPGAAARAYLASRAQLGVKFGLKTMRALTEKLDHPEARYATLLVAGTNGKGSVVAYADAVLRVSGLKVGRYTSPHLVRVNERLVVNGREIEDEDLDTVVTRVRDATEGMVDSGAIPGHATHFEVLTAAAFEHFRRAAVDVAVLEVGMGGRLDATNVCEPIASAIVSIDRDHETYLGSRLEAIAREKAGVLRSGRATVLGPLPPEARGAVADAAKDSCARLVDAPSDVHVLPEEDGVRVRTPWGEYAGLRPLPGSHQQANLLVAIRLLEEARQAGLPVDLKRLPEGIAQTRWPGRLQWIDGRPPLLLDGAHNPAGARALADYMRGRGPFVLLFGVMADKHVSEMARVLFPMARAVVLTRPPQPRAASPEEIAEQAGSLAAGARHEPDAGRALALARRLAAPREPVVVAGSLYLVGEVLKRLGGR